MGICARGHQCDHGSDVGFRYENATESLLPPPDSVLLPDRPRDAHKGTFGTAVVLAGSLDRTLSTLFHECTHLVIHQACGDGVEVPTWANEGLAVFFENLANLPDGKVK